MKNCKHKLCNPLENKFLCGAYSKCKLPNGVVWAHYPECKDGNCPLEHPELLGDAISDLERPYLAGLSAEGSRTVIVYLTLEEKKVVDKFIEQLHDNDPIYDEGYCGSVWINNKPEKGTIP